MNTQQMNAWLKKTKELNVGVVLKIGLEVKDLNGRKGVIVKIREPEDAEDHGTVYVWLSEVTGYGDDNCEHYCWTNWHDFLRVI